MEILPTLGHQLALVLLAVALLGGLLLVPLGLPGLWLMLAAGLVYWLAVSAGGIGAGVLAVAVVLVLVAELLEFTISGRFARRYGGSNRASWGAILGGLVGAIVGVPVPVVGSLVGAVVGSFAGALVGELTVHRDKRGDPGRVAVGALIGRAAASAVKTLVGVLVVVLLFGAALSGGAP